jgi:hypothetical protein
VLIYDINREQLYKKYPVVNLLKIDKIQKGKWRCIYPEPHKFIDNVIKYYRNGLLILDDTDRYLSSANIDWKNLLIGHRHFGHDVIAVFHSLNRVLPIFYENCTDIILFKTQEYPEKLIYKLPNPDIIIKAYDELQKMEQYKYKFIKIR